MICVLNNTTQTLVIRSAHKNFLNRKLSSFLRRNRNEDMAARLIISTISILTVHFVSVKGFNNTQGIICPFFKNGPSLDSKDLVGSWMTVFTHPRAIHCFTLHIRATTDLEREQAVTKYGNFSSKVHWNLCLLEVESPLGKHYLQGNGSNAGLLENIIISLEAGKFTLHDQQSADQWTIFGQRGRELLLMRDCSGEAAAVFARAPYWPSSTELYAILHRSGITPISYGRVLCEPVNLSKRQCPISRYFSDNQS